MPLSSQIINETIVGQLALNDERKNIFRERYLALLRDFQRRSCRYGKTFHGLRSIVSIGSLLVPALLSIQYIPTTGSGSDSSGNSSANNIALYWITWVISLLVTMSNGIYTLMKVDKKYYFLNTIVEQLRSEGWQFISLTGRYAGTSAVIGSNTHEYQFLYFCHMIEKIKMHQVEEEYFKLTDEYTKGHGSGSHTTNTGTSRAVASAGTGITDTVSTTIPMASSNGALPSLIPPTPEQPLSTVMNMLPTDLREGLEAALGIRPAAAAAGTQVEEGNNNIGGQV